MTNGKFVEVHSFNYDTIDELIVRLKEYKKLYGGDCMITVDTYFQEDDCPPEIYYGINTKESKNESKK